MKSITSLIFAILMLFGFENSFAFCSTDMGSLGYMDCAIQEQQMAEMKRRQEEMEYQMQRQQHQMQEQEEMIQSQEEMMQRMEQQRMRRYR